MAFKKDDNNWSNLVIKQLEVFFKSYELTFPLFEYKNVSFAPGTNKGPDCIVSIQFRDKKRILLIEIEQYASGSKHNNKLSKWAENHFTNSEIGDTTTFVIGLLLPALRNRLITHKDDLVKKMVFSNKFRIFPGIGDGSLSEELKSSLNGWLNRCYED
ncbi:hypothetical protein [Brevibacillus agri]|uniref:hypothetical protein n=1 Tax=Brevibacillus agri TaxID=51101 RepID=UPI002867EA06|nr:hypothetical protein [Brevibacillus agri]